MSSIYFGGSRSLPSSALPYVARVVGAVLAGGHVVTVGCATGADAQVIQCARRFSSFPQVRVFAAFGPSGAGSWSGSAVAVVQAWAQAGGSVSWLAGGSLAVPLRARLIRRSAAAFAGCSSAVFFAPGAGSLAVAAQAAAAGLSVFAFSQAQPAPIPAAAGAWSASSFFGFTCWQFQPAQQSFF